MLNESEVLDFQKTHLKVCRNVIKCNAHFGSYSNVFTPLHKSTITDTYITEREKKKCKLALYKNIFEATPFIDASTNNNNVKMLLVRTKI